MKAWMRVAMPVACSATLGMLTALGGDDRQPSLNSEQQHAVGIVVAHPLAATAPERIEALGLVLDATALSADMGDAAASAALQRSASAELKRLHALHDGGAGASLRMLEAAQADQARAQAQAEIAAARFASRWGPLATLPFRERQKVIEESTSGRGLLLRADLLGRHTLGAPITQAVLDVDGIEVKGRVLGTLRETSELQSVGLLIEVPNAPAGLGYGARIPVALLTAARAGQLVPRDALLYGENGAYVYKQLKTTGAKTTSYAPVKVKLLTLYGDSWLVDGVDADDIIVVHGAGVLWSLQGVGAQQHDDDD